MLHSRPKYEYLPRNERIVTLVDIEDDLSFEQVNRDWPVRMMGRHGSASRKRYESQAQRTLFHERSSAPSVPDQQILIDYLLIVLQMMDQHVTFDGTAQRRHVAPHFSVNPAYDSSPPTSRAGGESRCVSCLSAPRM
jgi:hypothetical protein